MWRRRPPFCLKNPETRTTPVTAQAQRRSTSAPCFHPLLFGRDRSGHGAAPSRSADKPHESPVESQFAPTLSPPGVPMARTSKRIRESTICSTSQKPQ